MPGRHQPWSLLFSQNRGSLECVVLSAPERAQYHHAIEELGDILVIDKSTHGVEIEFEESTFEIIGYDKRILFEKLSELCTGIELDYVAQSEPDSLAEYEVV